MLEQTLILICSLSLVLGFGITVPGTNWCGPGNNAESYDDLGAERELDMCCRAHDNCEEKISPRQTNYGLTNEGLFPIFSCACEDDFRKCLTSLHSVESGALGRIYFSSTESCLGYGHPIRDCQEQQWDITFQKRCLKYREDKTQAKRWQFYDLALYTHISESEQNEDSSET